MRKVYLIESTNNFMDDGVTTVGIFSSPESATVALKSIKENSSRKFNVTVDRSNTLMLSYTDDKYPRWESFEVIEYELDKLSK